MFDEVGDGADELVCEDCKAVAVESRERVTVGMTTTVAVDIRTPGDRYQPEQNVQSGKKKTSQPTSTHSYPGMQQPPPDPPELVGQLVYPFRQPTTC